MNKIYSKTPEKKTITGFIKALYSHEYGSMKYAVETFTDEDCTVRECKPARRSFDDLVTIVKTRYPKTSKKRVAKAIKRLCEAHGFKMHLCTTIKKPVLVYYEGDFQWPIELYPTYRVSQSYEQKGYEDNAEMRWEEIQKLMGA